MAPCFSGLRVRRGQQLLQILEHQKKKNTDRWASYHWRCSLHTSLIKNFIQICHQKKPCKGVLTCVVRTKKKIHFKNIIVFCMHVIWTWSIINQPLWSTFQSMCKLFHHHEAFMSCIHIQNETLQELMTNFILENQIVGFIWFIMSMKNKWIDGNWVPTNVLKKKPLMRTTAG